MNYYKDGSKYVSTIGVLDLPEVSKEEFEAAMESIKSDQVDTIEPEPTAEERIAALEYGQATLSEELAAAKILLGLEE